MIEVISKEFRSYIQNRFGIVTDSSSDKTVTNFINKNIELFLTENWREILDKEELQDFANSITITETYFFRDKRQLNVLIEDIKNKLKTSKDKPTFNIWSMGASSGEEAYSVSILINEMKQKNELNFKITGFDINTKNIAKARKGNYNEWSFRGVDKYTISKHFKSENDGTFTIKDELKSKVSFVPFNIVSDIFDERITIKYGIPDYILLRNTVMYFNKETVAKVIERMYKLLQKEGILIPGIQELRIFKSGNINYDYILDTCVFIKSDIRRTTQQKFQQRSISSANRPKLVANAFTEKLNNGDTKTDLKSNLDTYSGLIKSAIISFEERNTIEAHSICDKAILQNDSHHIAYYLKSLFFYESGNVEEAHNYIKKAVFLNPDSPLSNYYLATIMMKKNNFSKAFLHLRKAQGLLDLLEDTSELEILDITKEDIKEYIQLAFHTIEVKK